MLISAPTAFAAETPENNAIPQVEIVDGVAGDESSDYIDYLYETITRGDVIPRYTTSLPYTAGSSGFSSFVYTNYKFKPSSSGVIYSSFTGSCSSSTTVKLALYEEGKGSPILTESMGKASSWSNKRIKWYNLNKDKYYYYCFTKTSDGISVSFNCKFTTT